MILQSIFIPILFIAVAFLDAFCAFRCFSERKAPGVALGCCMVSACVVTVFYLITILTDDYFINSLCSSIYFSAIDVMLLFLLRFFYAVLAIDYKKHRWTLVLFWAFRILVALDVISLMLNPIFEHAISYDYNAAVDVAPFEFAPHALYSAHLVLCYLMIAYGFAIMILKSVRVPAVYRRIYLTIVGCVFVIVVLNALYLFTKVEQNIDISIIFYSFLGYAIYSSVFVFGVNEMADQVCHMMVRDVDAPILIFDNNNMLFFINTKAKEVFPQLEVGEHASRLKDFSRLFEENDVVFNSLARQRFYWKNSDPNDPTSYICDFEVYKDKRGRIVAKTFRLTDNTVVESDLVEAGLVESSETSIPSNEELMAPVNYTRYVIDSANKVIEIDDNFEWLTGYTQWDIDHEGLNQNDLIFEEDRKLYWEMVADSLGVGGVTYLEHRIRRKDGTGKYVYCTGILSGDGASQKRTIIVTDVTDSVSVKQQIGAVRNRAVLSLKRLEETVRIDPLTGLLNRPAFKRAIEDSLMQASKICVLMMVDVDDFKVYNDTLGHPEGDNLLCALARQMEESVGDNGCCARLGGDEFCCLLSYDVSTSQEQLESLVSRVWAEISSKMQEMQISSSVSAGALIIKHDMSSFNELYEKADAALYAAKQAGKNQIHIECE